MPIREKTGTKRFEVAFFPDDRGFVGDFQEMRLAKEDDRPAIFATLEEAKAFLAEVVVNGWFRLEEEMASEMEEPDDIQKLRIIEVDMKIVGGPPKHWRPR
jgi:hypothetical protein